MLSSVFRPTAKQGPFFGSRLLLWLLLILSLSGLPVSAPMAASTAGEFTPEEQAFIKEHPVLRVHNETDWPPFNFYENGRPVGYSIDYMNLLAEKTGFRIEYVTGPSWDEFMQMIRAKDIDVMLNIVNTEARREFLAFTDAYLVAAASIFTRKGSFTVESLDDLQGKTVVIPKGFFWQELLERHYPDIKLLLVKDSLACLEAVAFGRADATVGMVGVLDYLLQKNFIPNLVLAAQVRDERFSSVMNLAVNKDNTALRDILQKGMALITEDELIAIQRRWGERKAGASMQISKEERLFLQQHPIIRAHVEKDYSPFLYTNAGRATGYAVDYVNLLAEKMGVEIHYDPGRTRAQAIDALENRQLSLIVAMAESDSPSPSVLFTRPFLTTYTGIALRKGMRGVTSLDALKEMRVATISGYRFEPLLRDRYPNMQLKHYDSHLLALEAVAAAEVDAAIMSHPVMRNLIQKNFLSDLTTLPVQEDTLLKRSEEALAIRSDWPLLRELLDRAIASVSQEEIDRLKRKWNVELQGGELSDVSFTDRERAYLKQRKVIRMCVAPDWMPYESIDENGKLQGMTADFVQLIEARLGIQWKLVPTSNWGETLAEAKVRNCDVITLIAPTAERQAYLSFTTPYINFPSVIATRSEELFVENVSQVKSRPLGVVKDYAIGGALRLRYPDINLVEVESIQDGLEKVRSKTIYGFIGAAETIGYAIRQLGYPDVKIAGKTEFVRELSMGVRNDDPLLYSVIDKAVRATTTEERQKIFSRWIAVEYVSGVNYLLIGKILLAVFLVLSFFVYQNRRLARFNREIRIANEKAEQKNALLVEKTKELEELSITDRLTQIYNRIKLEEVFNQEIRRAERYGLSFSVIMLDIDGFKQVNDKYGHPVGDQVLIEMANVLRSGIRVTDTLGRWGGEEFFIVCPETDRDGAYQLAQLLCQRIAQHDFPEVERLTASFGVAIYRSGEREHNLVRRADAALYQAKALGKNRVEVSDD